MSYGVFLLVICNFCIYKFCTHSKKRENYVLYCKIII